MYASLLFHGNLRHLGNLLRPVSCTYLIYKVGLWHLGNPRLM